MPVTPQTLTQSGHGFAVKVIAAGALAEYDVSVTASQGKLSPFWYARLFLAGQGDIADVPVAESQSQNTISFRFKVSPSLLEHSRFVLTEQAYGVAEDAQGKKQIIPFLGGTVYEFALGDFSPTKAQ